MAAFSQHGANLHRKIRSIAECCSVPLIGMLASPRPFLYGRCSLIRIDSCMEESGVILSRQSEAVFSAEFGRGNSISWSYCAASL
jgi:hypothetical protein